MWDLKAAVATKAFRYIRFMGSQIAEKACRYIYEVGLKKKMIHGCFTHIYQYLIL